MQKEARMARLGIMVCALTACAASATDSATALEEQFRNPPVEARPSSFWPWIGGHITREGIQADLEAMKASGMRGGINSVRAAHCMMENRGQAGMALT